MDATTRRRSSGEEPVLGDPPSREDSLLGHMPSVNPAVDKQFEDAISTVSGEHPGRQARLERLSEGLQHSEQSRSRDGESAPSNEARCLSILLGAWRITAGLKQT